mmetsp:Transcript_15217/g.19854  ORF Transcript_15217/g.19854 Transcript_15217/m.19854 type:complete len:214 (+) Transcript_15217:224-865(+)
MKMNKSSLDIGRHGDNEKYSSSIVLRCTENEDDDSRSSGTSFYSAHLIEADDDLGDYMKYSGKMDELVIKNPCLSNISKQERLRFLIASKGNVSVAANRIQTLIEFRKGEFYLHRKYLESVKARKESKTLFDEGFLRLVTFTDLKALDGTRIVYVIPSTLDLSKIELRSNHLSAAQQQALSLSVYFDNSTSRSSMEKLTVLIDVRGKLIPYEF